MKIEKKKISDLKFNPNNPRKSTPEQEANLKLSLEKFGVVEPIVFNERTGQVVGGHFRIRELKKLGVKEVDCVIVDLSPEDENELNIRLNANTGEWDYELLQEDWNVEELEEWGLEMPNIDNLSDNEEIEIEQSVQIEPPKEYIMIICEPNSVEWEKLKADLRLKMVRKGGYKKNSPFDAIGLERVLTYKEFKERYDNSSTK